MQCHLFIFTSTLRHTPISLVTHHLGDVHSSSNFVGRLARVDRIRVTALASAAHVANVLVVLVEHLLQLLDRVHEHVELLLASLQLGIQDLLFRLEPRNLSLHVGQLFPRRRPVRMLADDLKLSMVTSS